MANENFTDNARVGYFSCGKIGPKLAQNSPESCKYSRRENEASHLLGLERRRMLNFKFTYSLPQPSGPAKMNG